MYGLNLSSVIIFLAFLIKPTKILLFQPKKIMSTTITNKVAGINLAYGRVTRSRVKEGKSPYEAQYPQGEM